jgi:hypothetical protein
MEIGLADLAISQDTGLHVQLRGVQWTHIRRPRPNSVNSPSRMIETLRYYGLHQDASFILMEPPDDDDLLEQ